MKEIRMQGLNDKCQPDHVNHKTLQMNAILQYHMYDTFERNRKI